MLLREDHIAVFQANWKDKACNLEGIAETLSPGLDSLVLLDAHQEFVRRARPELVWVAIAWRDERDDFDRCRLGLSFTRRLRSPSAIL
jgi:predicted enzyme involved in methoxymalonyl-ACP biosynthesis